MEIGLIEGDDRLLSPGGMPPRRPSSALGDDSDSLTRNLKLSSTLHAVLLAILILKSLVFPGKPKTYQPALRVDLVGLPDLLKKDLSQISPATPAAPSPAEESKKEEKEATPPKSKPIPAPVREQADPDEMVERPTKGKSLAERNRERIKELEKQTRAEEERKKKMEASLRRMKSLAKLSEIPDARPGILIKGNQISRGSSLSGDARETSEASYYDQVRARLQEKWELPVWLSRQSLSAKVEIFIDQRGMVRTFRFTKPSGNPQFDEAVKRTLQASQPFPPPPSAEADSLLAYGISVGFPL